MPKRYTTFRVCLVLTTKVSSSLVNDSIEAPCGISRIIYLGTLVEDLVGRQDEVVVVVKHALRLILENSSWEGLQQPGVAGLYLQQAGGFWSNRALQLHADA